MAEVAKEKGIALSEMEKIEMRELEAEVAAHQALGEITAEINRLARESANGD